LVDKSIKYPYPPIEQSNSVNAFPLFHIFPPYCASCDPLRTDSFYGFLQKNIEEPRTMHSQAKELLKKSFMGKIFENGFSEAVRKLE